MENQQKDYRKIFLEKCEARKERQRKFREKFILKMKKRQLKNKAV